MSWKEVRNNIINNINDQINIFRKKWWKSSAQKYH